jgi:hypothetical protein
LAKGAGALPRTGDQHACLGVNLAGAPVAATVRQGARAVLTQEVRNPRAGQYVFTVHACGGGSSAAYYREVFLKHFECRLSIFGYTDLDKNPLRVREFASLPFTPPFADGMAGQYEKFELSRVLRSQDAGAFETSQGVGVAVTVEKTSPDVLEVVAGERAFIRIDDTDVLFIPRPRDDSVMV